MKCDSCPNRPFDSKKYACDNCVKRQRKRELEGILSLSFGRTLDPKEGVKR